MKPIFTGSATALVTPFSEDTLYLEELGKLIERQISAGTAALVVCGTTGEPVTMSQYEKDAVLSYTLEKVNGRLPVIAGAGSNSTSDAVKAARRAAELGADAILSVTPYYNKCSDEGLVRHFSSIADAAAIPTILYNVPSRTGLNMSIRALVRLSGHPMIAGVKEASGSVTQMMDMMEQCPGLAFWSGTDELNLALIACGASGMISVASNIAPEACAELASAALSGNREKALRLQQWLNPLIRALFIETNPIPVKTALRLMGYNVGTLRLPLCDMTEEHESLLRSTLQSMGFLKGADT